MHARKMMVLTNPTSDVGSNLRMDHQERLIDRLGLFWEEWEIQSLVLVSFALQVFLLLFSGIRKRRTPGAVSILLWLAYLSADSLAIFVLGHLTLHINGPRHGLTLFWAPFMLQHLGGQETITAFSMEDNVLWKRHLLNLATQVGLAAYVVGKQWQGDKQLLAPMVLMFFSGTIKYAGRTSALMLAAKPAPYIGTDHSLLSNINVDEEPWGREYFLARRVMEGGKTDQEMIVSAYLQLYFHLGLLMETKPGAPRIEEPCARAIKLNENRVHDCYKIVEFQLSFAYDFFYTKLGARFEHKDPLNGRFFWLVTMGSTFTALVLFACKADHFKYSRADVAVSYILLIGAIILEVLSLFIATSSYWVYSRKAANEGCCCSCLPSAAAIFSIVKHVHPTEGSPKWSQKLAQYNLIDGCVNAARASCMLRIMRRIGIKGDTTHVAVSAELKKFLLDKLLDVVARASTRHDSENAGEEAWDYSKFTCHWARSELRRRLGPPHRMGDLEDLLITKSNLGLAGFMSTVLTWHIATDICFFHDEDSSSSSSPSRTTSRELSNYVMYLCAEHGVMSGNDGHVLLYSSKDLVTSYNLEYNYQGGREKKNALVDGIRPSVNYIPKTEGERFGVPAVAAVCVFNAALQLSEELTEKTIKEASDRWVIIMNIWMEMLCYMAVHTGPAGFHTKHLSTGGEFITHVKVLMYNLGLSTP